MISELEYRVRRELLLAYMSKDSLGIICASAHKIRSNDTEYAFRQSSNFFYLSGMQESDAVLVFDKSGIKGRVILFVKEQSEQEALWVGSTMGVAGAKKSFMVDEVYGIKELDSRLRELVVKKRTIYAEFASPKVSSWLDMDKNIDTLKDISRLIGKMRLVKSESEISMIKKAIKITKNAHHKAMKMKKDGRFEYEIAAMMEYEFKRKGADFEAYGTIAASANNANTLHYVKNSQKMRDGSLVLIDAGCEYGSYASDITRTIPVGGKFSDAQREVYEIVLGTQKRIIKLVKAGVLRSDLQKKAELLLTKGLVKLGVLHGKPKELVEKKLHKPYYPHGIGHHMGLDVHDEVPYTKRDGKEIALRAGMVLTIEPGLYLSKDDKKIPKRYRGIGVRIEDNILVTNSGCENLSKKIKKEIEDIERQVISGNRKTK